MNGRLSKGWWMSAGWDTAGTAFVWGCALAATLALAWLIGGVLSAGAGVISWEFLTSEPSDAGRAGGIGTILVATCWILAVASMTSLPVGIGAAVWLAECNRDGQLGRWVRGAVDLLAGVPSIVFGLFGNAFFCQFLGLGYSILSGGLTLAVMILPLLVRVSEQGLRAVPDQYRMAAAALGLSRTTTFLHVVLPQAVPALLAGFLLATARALSETAALIFTSGYVARMPRSLFDSGRAISVHVYDLVMHVPGGERRAAGAALVLVLLLLAIHSLTNLFARQWLSHVT
ncbi:MAG: phosphate ABC transporter, permease protein PstA [Pirellulaceae bacterium]|nr:MAG: phosphate ABC transporter, permease protein PstA [Pirellulaceae bacterium]